MSEACPFWFQTRRFWKFYLKGNLCKIGALQGRTIYHNLNKIDETTYQTDSVEYEAKSQISKAQPFLFRQNFEKIFLYVSK